MMIGWIRYKEVLSMVESKEQLETWCYLKEAYYPRFKEGICKLEWDNRFDVLKRIHGEWIDKGDDPIESMMDYVFEKGYFGIFCRGITVFEDGSFKLHSLISANLGKVGICDGWF